MKPNARNLLKTALAALTLASASAALAQAWPSKPITVIWPYPPGGSASEVKMRALYN